MTTNNDMKEATIRMIMLKHRLNRAEATKYVDKILGRKMNPKGGWVD